MDHTLTTLLIAFCVSAAAAIYTITEAIKNLVTGWLYEKQHATKDPWWWQGLWRLVPMLLGLAAGAWADWTVELFEYPVGLFAGTVSGVFCVVLYNKLKDALIALKLQGPRKPPGPPDEG